MTDGPPAISNALANRMVREINPAWTVIETSPMAGGHHPVAIVAIETQTERRQAVLKATGEGVPDSAATEVRMLRLLATETSLPVPDVIGAVDDHDHLPAPFFLMEELPGTKHPRLEMDGLDPGVLATIARSAGEKLAALHQFDGLNAFGRVTHRRDGALHGGRPSGTIDELTLDHPFDDWSTVVERWADQACEALAEGHSNDLRFDLRASIEQRTKSMNSPARPVLAHIDWSLDNLLHDPDSHAVVGLPDWEFTVAATRGYDLVYAVNSLSGGPWYRVPSFPDNQELVRDALVAGYRAQTPSSALAEYEAHRETYRLLNTMHGMIHTVDRLELDGATAEQIQGATEWLREQANAAL